MSQPEYPLVLGGVVVPVLSGPAPVAYEPVGGKTGVRMHGGKLVQMTHWERMTIVINGAGWMGPGLESLDFSQDLELLCTKDRRLNTTALTCTLTSDVRPDVPAWCDAIFADHSHHRTPIVVVGREVTITPVAGAVFYSVGWLPRFMVQASRPSESGSGRDNEWQIVCEEV
ncbi:MAG: hypothetical protein CVV07_07405 [Gammaproteobacteria bacterium HGW-Gammaproteobacteria-11]|nr:MAG: hypothetical protein CVV07_07405 [Gammaproteobacteria bacterium HGW-Gammaproteobacteria-11]